jgi:membrane-associated phospholipid phosphatase
MAAGSAAAAAILAARAGDGSGVTPPPYTLSPGPGVFEPIAPATAVFTHWSSVKPFVLQRASQFRPPPPPALNSAAYATAIKQVQSLGVANGSSRTADQSQIAQFWAGNIWDFWNEIAQTAAIAHHDTLDQDARLFAVLNVSFADSVIAFYDAKYTYHLWRPIAAIRQASLSGNPALTQDLAWTPFAKTPADPSYPGAHATIAEAGATILSSFFRTRAQKLTVTSESLPGVLLTFTSFGAAAGEASVSRIFAGVHSSIDEAAGLQLGRSVARFALGNGPLATAHTSILRHAARSHRR